MDICEASERASVCICYYLLYCCSGCCRCCCGRCCAAFWYLSKSEFVVWLNVMLAVASTWKCWANRQNCVGWCWCWYVCMYVCIHKHQIIHFLLAVTHLAHLIFSLPLRSLGPVFGFVYWFLFLCCFYIIFSSPFWFSVFGALSLSLFVRACVRAWMNQWLYECMNE